MAWYFYLIIVLAVLLVLFLLYTYNSLIRVRNQMKNAWAQIDVQLKRRHDLIPNLVETAKGYMKHERETFEAVTNARNMAQAAVGTGVAAQAKAEGALGGFLGRLLAVAENYPDLKANTNFLALQEELSSTENKISFSRQFYNDSVLGYNNKIQMFPSNIIAGMFGFKIGEFFEIEVAAEREVPKVSFS
jgi:LemA protein